MTTFHEYMRNEGRAPAWPYPIRYDQEHEMETDVLVIGGGIAGCWAAISAARKGVRVTLVEKSATVRSGAGGPGCDHWCDTPSNPLSKVDPDEWAQKLTDGFGGYGNGIGREIQCRENYHTLLELEKMGGKIRDSEDRFKGVEGRDDKTKFLISPRLNPFHDTNVVIRVWGTTFKPALKKECERLGVKLYDRVMATSLLTEKDIQGERVVGATGVNARTGEFMIFKSKATILCSSSGGSIWLINTELSGYNTMTSRAVSGDGIAMAWQAGAEFTLMERSGIMGITPGFKHRWYTGAGDASYENVMLVDAGGKTLPIVTEPGWRQKDVDRMGFGFSAIREKVLHGEYALPFYGDFPSMPEIERCVVWNMLLEEESTGKIIVDTYSAAGFNPARDQISEEKVRIYAPVRRNDGIDWKALHAGIARAMQYYCSEYKTESLFNIGLEALQKIEDEYVPMLYALDPHKLIRSLEDMSILTHARIHLHASLARKASNQFLGFHRIDYPQPDPPEWRKFITVRQSSGKAKIGELPLDYWGNLKNNYEAHNKDYQGIYDG